MCRPERSYAHAKAVLVSSRSIPFQPNLRRAASECFGRLRLYRLHREFCHISSEGSAASPARRYDQRNNQGNRRETRVSTSFTCSSRCYTVSPTSVHSHGPVIERWAVSIRSSTSSALQTLGLHSVSVIPILTMSS